MSTTRQPNYKVSRDPDRTDFCYYPFFQVLMTAEGKYKACSKHGDFITHEGRVLTATEATPTDAWNSDYMQKLRSNFKSGVRSHGCRECWREQDMGLKPMRYDSYFYPIPDHQVEDPRSPMRIEINASNVCNLRCRICSPSASHKWIREAKELYGWDEEVHINLTPENRQVIESWLPNMIELGFFGGEPLLSDDNIALLEHCVKTGHSKHIKVLINTNGTVYDDRLVALFEHFDQVLLNFSIDDVGHRFEYQRKGANWNKVVENIGRYMAVGGTTDEDRICLKLCCTVSTLNMYYFPEYFETFNRLFPGMRVYWNLLYDPWQLSVQLLPEDIKQVIRERLRQEMDTSYEQTEFGTKTVDTLLTYLDGADDRSFDGFFHHIAKHDAYRKESYQDVFPEFWKHIQDRAPADLKTSQSIPTPAMISDETYKTAKHVLNERVLPLRHDRKGLAEHEEAIRPALFSFLEACIHRFGFPADQERAKHARFRQLYEDDAFDRPGFLVALSTYGCVRIAHLIHEHTTDDLEVVLREQYMSTYDVV